jgi:hypothetical protein
MKMEKTTTVKLEVTLEFSGHMPFNHRQQVITNVFNALIHEIDTVGIVPDHCEEYTKVVTVKGAGYNDQPLTHKFIPSGFNSKY